MEKPGDQIKVTTKERTYEGQLMPQEGDYLVLKLKSGYNIGIDRKKISGIELLKKSDKTSNPLAQIKNNPSLPTISVLHTGGTIASKVDYSTGGVSAKFSPEELVALFPEINEIANLKSRLVASLMSENIRFAHYNILAQEIEKEVKAGVDGIIITHGTDTMHYTSAALSFMLQDLPIPVIIVGAQRSSDRGSSDAAMNFLSAARFIASSDFAGVAICMHEGMNDGICFVMHGATVRKMHTSRRDAFRPVNSEAIAEVDHENKSIKIISNDYVKKSTSKNVKVMLFKESLKVGILKCHTNMWASQFLSYLGFDGLVLELTGLGQGPIINFDENSKENENIKNAIKELVKTGTVVVGSPETIYGRLQMNVYSEGRKMQELGVIGNYNMLTPETSFIKLSWLLSNYDKDKAKELFLQDLRKEMKTRTPEEGFLS